MGIPRRQGRRRRDAAAALIREIKEELGCDIILVRALPRFIHTYDRTTIEMIPFVCRLAPGSPEPQPTEHVTIAWARPGELDTYDLAAADLPVVAALPQPGVRSARDRPIPASSGIGR